MPAIVRFIFISVILGNVFNPLNRLIGDDKVMCSPDLVLEVICHEYIVMAQGFNLFISDVIQIYLRVINWKNNVIIVPASKDVFLSFWIPNKLWFSEIILTTFVPCLDSIIQSMFVFFATIIQVGLVSCNDILWQLRNGQVFNSRDLFFKRINSFICFILSVFSVFSGSCCVRQFLSSCTLSIFLLTF